MPQRLELRFDAEAFSVVAVQKACHRFSNTASFDIRSVRSGEAASITVTATPLLEKAEASLDRLELLLRNEVLDQQLRETIRAQTEGVRNLILAHAFSKTGLISNKESSAST